MAQNGMAQHGTAHVARHGTARTVQHSNKQAASDFVRLPHSWLLINQIGKRPEYRVNKLIRQFHLDTGTLLRTKA